jgi:ATP-dependent helicase/DNAse subunit B|tara:strand:+ start:10306 stop:10599 length:294 start_codon:yes stop_codon:yes gene_type:complete
MEQKPNEQQHTHKKIKDILDRFGHKLTALKNQRNGFADEAAEIYSHLKMLEIEVDELHNTAKEQEERIEMLEATLDARAESFVDTDFDEVEEIDTNE